MQEKPNPYTRFEKQQLILRDELALDRTVLANERTLLAYLRTAIALILAGVTFLHFAEALWFSAVGIISLILGFAFIPLTLHRYRKMQLRLNPLRQSLDTSPPPEPPTPSESPVNDTPNSP